MLLVKNPNDIVVSWHQRHFSDFYYQYCTHL